MATGDTKIDKEDAAGRSDHQIGWLEVAKDYGWVLVVQVIQHLAHLHSDGQGLVSQEGAAQVVLHLVQGHPVHPFHEEGQAFVDLVVDLQHAGYARVLKAREQVHLPLEKGFHFGPVAFQHQRKLQLFEGPERAAQARVAHQVDGAHGAFA